jgi:CheY-like chemotaxis protein
MPKGGELTFAVEPKTLDAEACRRYPGSSPGPHVLLWIADTGCGMPQDSLLRIFEPFFTTKEQGKGTGLGLSMVFGFMKQSGGHITVYSEPGKGTTFRLYLPRVHETLAEPEDRSEEPASRGGSETILVVEDNAGLRRIVVRQLGEAGYRVLEAPDAEAAMTIIESPEPIHLLLTDVVMPGPMDGRDLARLERTEPGRAHGAVHGLRIQHRGAGAARRRRARLHLEAVRSGALVDGRFANAARPVQSACLAPALDLPQQQDRTRRLRRPAFRFVCHRHRHDGARIGGNDDLSRAFVRERPGADLRRGGDQPQLVGLPGRRRREVRRVQLPRRALRIELIPLGDACSDCWPARSSTCTPGALAMWMASRAWNTCRCRLASSADWLAS